MRAIYVCRCTIESILIREQSHIARPFLLQARGRAWIPFICGIWRCTIESILIREQSHSQIQNSFDQSQCLSFHPLVQEVNEICSPRSSIIHVALSGYQISLTFRKRQNGERLKNKLLNKIILWKSVPFRTLGHIY